MTRAKKQLSKTSDIGSGELRKSVCFAAAVPCQTDYRLGPNARLGDEDLLEVHREKDDSVSEDLRAVSSIRPFSI